MKVEVTQLIDRPVATVFGFCARDHVRNHPRWDPMMQLEQITDGPIGVGTVIRRRNTHFVEPIEGTMEVTKFDPDHAIHTGRWPRSPAGSVRVPGPTRVEPARQPHSTEHTRAHGGAGAATPPISSDP